MFANDSAQLSRINAVTSSVCEFCDPPGHTEEKCFLNPESPNKKLSSRISELMSTHPIADSPAKSKNLNILKESKSNNGKYKMGLVGSLLQKTSISPAEQSKTYADSGATVHCFHNKH